MTSKALALAAATMAMLGSAVPMGPSAATYQDVRLTMPAQQAPARVLAQAQTSNRDENERVNELVAIPMRPMRFGWDGKNRRPGDRAHKRWKRARRA